MRKFFGVLVVACLLAVLTPPAAAEQSESTDPVYNFAKVRTVLVMAPAFTYNGYDVSGDDRFVKYPDAAGKISAMLNGKLKRTANLRYITLDYVIEQVKAGPGLDCDPKSPEFAALVKREMYKYADLVLYLTIRDYGWFYEYRPAYDSWETVTDRVRYYGKTPDGKDFSGWKEVERQVLVHHPPHYDIYDSAEADFVLVNPLTQRNVWTFIDVRSRSSPDFGRGYDRTGPESMMERIFDEAMGRMPIYPKDE